MSKPAKGSNWSWESWVKWEAWELWILAFPILPLTPLIPLTPISHRQAGLEHPLAQAALLEKIFFHAPELLVEQVVRLVNQAEFLSFFPSLFIAGS
jgi:hypothetical protein